MSKGSSILLAIVMAIGGFSLGHVVGSRSATDTEVADAGGEEAQNFGLFRRPFTPSLNKRKASTHPRLADLMQPAVGPLAAFRTATLFVHHP